MKHNFYSLLLCSFLFGCSVSRPISIEPISPYMGVVNTDYVVVYEKDNNEPLKKIGMLGKGDSVIVIGEMSNSGQYIEVRTPNYHGLTYKAFVRKTSKVPTILSETKFQKVDNTKPEEKVFAIVPSGFSVGYSTDLIFSADVFSNSNQEIFMGFGLSYKPLNAKGELKTEQKANYGKSITSHPYSVFLIDGILGYTFYETVTTSFELSVGSKSKYIEFSDKRFKDDHYYMKDQSVFVFGYGGNVTFKINPQLFGFVGIHTIKELYFGLRMPITI